MRHLKKFNEAVIVPNELSNVGQIRSFEDLVEYGSENEFDVVRYSEFYDSLSNADKKTAPKLDYTCPPFFALFHPQRKKPMFVLVHEMILTMPGFKNIVNDVIGHERVHHGQGSRRDDKLELDLPSPTNKKGYFSNKDEIMAFSWTIANDLRDSRSIKDAFNLLIRTPISNNRRQESRPRLSTQLWDDITKFCDEKTINKYKKYIYLYLEKIFDDK